MPCRLRGRSVAIAALARRRLEQTYCEPKALSKTRQTDVNVQCAAWAAWLTVFKRLGPMQHKVISVGECDEQCL